MKFLFYGLNFSPELTGIGKYSGEMVRWLVANGHDVDVVTAPPYYPEWKVHKEYGGLAYRVESEVVGSNRLRVLRCPLWVPDKVSGKTRVLHLLSFAISSGLGFVSRLFRRPDVIISIAPTLACVPIVAVLGKLGGAHTWLHVQDFEVDAGFNMGMVQMPGIVRPIYWLESWLMRRFDRVSSISEKMVDRLREKGVGRSRCFLLPNWVDLSGIKPSTGPNAFRMNLGFNDEHVVLLYAGNMGEKQGLELVIEAARMLQSDQRVVFVLAGDGASRARLLERSKDLPNVNWLPLQPVDRLNELLNAADVHLLPQRADAADLVMPSKLTGMLASGKAVLGTAAVHTQLGSVLNEVGVRVDPGRVDQFVDAIRSLVADPAWRLELGRRGRVFAEINMDRDLILNQFICEVSRIGKVEIL